MRKVCRKMWWAVGPCTSSRKSSVQSESTMDIEEILKAKLATIKEEPAAELLCEETNTNNNNGSLLTKHHHHQIQRTMSKKMKNKSKKILLNVKMAGRLFNPQFSLKESYLLFMTGLAYPNTHCYKLAS